MAQLPGDTWGPLQALPDGIVEARLSFGCGGGEVLIASVADGQVPGGFHTMADSLRVGWHPRFREAVTAFITGLPANDQDEVSAVALVDEPAGKRKPATVPPAAVAAGDRSVDEGGDA
jgi:hypothetical protein